MDKREKIATNGIRGLGYILKKVSVTKELVDKLST